MADEIAVREMRLEDIDGIMEIEHGSFATPWTKQDLIGELSNTAARYFVVLEGEKVVAYAGTWLIIDEGHITNVAVHPDWRGRGCGTRVLYALIQAAIDVGVQYMTLEVRVSNEPALALYKNFGFKKAGLRKKYYEDNGEDAHIMVNDRLPQGLERVRKAHPELAALTRESE